ncbi:MAG TPA: hypothetical protein VGU61_05725 [Noviherbaspirillum sp.]|uniref:hypothetical protein n=1 Tax=Noviherbaspirillum sp. TaxID=1926288 RepID=UPI002DDD5D18|nr:hypothetical protein [Noviherbaspirillum sp.]HEV2609747.1 hypothetical protein [Noviherbaspirillum sp.]
MKLNLLSTAVCGLMVLPLAACSIIGHNIEKNIGVTATKPEGAGRPSLPADRAHPNVLTAIGAEIDKNVAKEVFKALTTGRQAKDMAMRDLARCLEDEVQVCSITTGCSCRIKRPVAGQ